MRKINILTAQDLNLNRCFLSNIIRNYSMTLKKVPFSQSLFSVVNGGKIKIIIYACVDMYREQVHMLLLMIQ